MQLLDDPEVFTGWILDHEETVTSTNHLAARLPAWHAVRADTQTAGRGRTGRHWVSDAGGLWLSAVVPCPGPRENWAMLPLAAGWALLGALASLGVSDLRLRWPNDLLVGPRKLAGLLVERHTPDTAVVGIGLNVFNHPESAEPALIGDTTRLADLVSLGDTTLDDLAGTILAALARVHSFLLADEFPRIAVDLNRAWTPPRRVALTLAGRPEPVTGLFLGIDSLGRLRLQERIGEIQTYAPTQVALLREL